MNPRIAQILAPEESLFVFFKEVIARTSIKAALRAAKIEETDADYDQLLERGINAISNRLVSTRPTFGERVFSGFVSGFNVQIVRELEKALSYEIEGLNAPDTSVFAELWKEANIYSSKSIQSGDIFMSPLSDQINWAFYVECNSVDANELREAIAREEALTSQMPEQIRAYLTFLSWKGILMTDQEGDSELHREEVLDYFLEEFGPFPKEFLAHDPQCPFEFDSDKVDEHDKRIGNFLVLLAVRTYARCEAVSTELALLMLDELKASSHDEGPLSYSALLNAWLLFQSDRNKIERLAKLMGIEWTLQSTTYSTPPDSRPWAR